MIRAHDRDHQPSVLQRVESAVDILEGDHIVNQLLPVGGQLDALGRVGMHIIGGGDLPDLGVFARLARGGLTGLEDDFGNGHGCVEVWSAGS
jgi:hypothetical protein